MLTIEGDWMDNGFIQDLAPRHLLVEVAGGKLREAETGLELSMDDDGELRGWACVTFFPDASEIARLRAALV